MAWYWALLLKPLVLVATILFFTTVCAAANWVLLRALPRGRLKALLFREWGRSDGRKYASYTRNFPLD